MRLTMISGFFFYLIPHGCLYKPVSIWSITLINNCSIICVFLSRVLDVIIICQAFKVQAGFLHTFHVTCLSNKFKSLCFSNAISIACHFRIFLSILGFVLQLDATDSVGFFFFYIPYSEWDPISCGKCSHFISSLFGTEKWMCGCV